VRFGPFGAGRTGDTYGKQMQSKNKKKPSKAESDHIVRIKEMPCQICQKAGPSEAHEIEQGLWWLSIPLCADCHRGSFNGIHGQKRMWSVMRKTELDALNETLEQLLR
jgi:hypothetical protein